MDDFVRKAFADANNAANQREADAFDEKIANQIETICTACGFVVGLEDMNNLSQVVLKAGLAETFAEWTRTTMIAAFSEGYRARMEEEGCQDR